MDALDHRLLNEFQHGFPLAPLPFALVGVRLSLSEEEVIARLGRLKREGAVSRIGAVFRPHAVGASTLAAMAVPEAELERVADLVSARPEVNHNYQREHRLNLWFVVCAASKAEVAAVLAAIAEETGIPVLDLPLVEDYHIDLGFDLNGGGRKPGPHPSRLASPVAPAALDDDDYDLVEALSDGLPLVPRPYAALGLPEDEALARIERMLDLGVIRRFGVVVRHHELGYRANAMAVFDVADEMAAPIGQLLAREPAVTLCYRRPRRLPEWRYTLFCMVHGRDQAEVRAAIDDMRSRAGILDLPHAVLFSTRRFKQCGARYGKRVGALTSVNPPTARECHAALHG